MSNTKVKNHAKIRLVSRYLEISICCLLQTSRMGKNFIFFHISSHVFNINYKSLWFFFKTQPLKGINTENNKNQTKLTLYRLILRCVHHSFMLIEFPIIIVKSPILLSTKQKTNTKYLSIILDVSLPYNYFVINIMCRNNRIKQIISNFRNSIKTEMTAIVTIEFCTNNLQTISSCS